MSSLLLIILSAVLLSMIAITDEGRWRPFANVTDVYQSAVGVAQAHALAVPLICALTWLLSNAVLKPLELSYLRTPAFVAVILVIVPLVEVTARRVRPIVPANPAFTLLLSANGAMLGVALMSEARAPSLWRALWLGIGSAVLFSFLLLCAATLYERLRYADVPKPFRHAPILLITAGLMALAFMGFTGLIQE